VPPRMTRRGTDRVGFEGEITGFGTADGHRVVVGDWPRSPFGPVADVMVESPAGHRVLLAPTEDLARFVSETYVFDEVRVEPVELRRGAGRRWLRAGPLEAEIHLGARDVLGWLLRCVPRRLARAPWWTVVTDPIARLVMPGVRTRGSAGNGRREWYGALDRHDVVEVAASWEGRSLGGLRDLHPPVRFGFGSAPRRPSTVAVVTTIELPR
jgi:hypothetical protein